MFLQSILMILRKNSKIEEDGLFDGAKMERLRTYLGGRKMGNRLYEWECM